MSGSGHQRKCSERSNDFRSATLTGHELAMMGRQQRSASCAMSKTARRRRSRWNLHDRDAGRCSLCCCWTGGAAPFYSETGRASNDPGSRSDAGRGRCNGIRIRRMRCPCEVVLIGFGDRPARHRRLLFTVAETFSSIAVAGRQSDSRSRRVCDGAVVGAALAPGRSGPRPLPCDASIGEARSRQPVSRAAASGMR